MFTSTKKTVVGILEITKKTTNMPNETCILCGKETTVDVNTHIDYRVGYIEGAGQLCISCYRKGTDREHITIPKSFILDFPNDMELGKNVRKYYYNNHHNNYENL